MSWNILCCQFNWIATNNLKMSYTSSTVSLIRVTTNFLVNVNNNTLKFLYL